MQEEKDYGAVQERLYEKMLSKELTWEGLIRDIVRNENLNPWDINISLLTRKYMGTLKKIKEMDIRVSGKFLLAAAILLKMKSDYLFEDENKEMEVEEKSQGAVVADENYDLIPHIPQPKKRKVTVDELISSLQKALVVSEKKKFRHKQREVSIKLKLRKVDLSEKIAMLFNRIVDFLKRFGAEEMAFSKLIPSRQREDIIWTFVPLIHLANKGKVSIRQEKEFGEIYVKQI